MEYFIKSVTPYAGNSNVEINISKNEDIIEFNVSNDDSYYKYASFWLSKQAAEELLVALDLLLSEDEDG